MKKIVSFITVFFVFAISIFARYHRHSPGRCKTVQYCFTPMGGFSNRYYRRDINSNQTILAKIPTEKSVKISGIIGKILDLLSFFPADNKKGRWHSLKNKI